MPSAENIYNCENSKGIITNFCGRAIIKRAPLESVTIVLNNLIVNSRYNIYYTVTNDFPLNPYSKNSIV